jgi:CBS domain containing-hemolysin-like protein
MEFFLRLLLVIFLVLLNGFFVASEFALVSVRRTRINELVKKGRRRPKLIQVALDDLQSFISATQLGITIASLALGWIGEPAIAHFIIPFFSFLPQTAATISAHTVSVTLAFLIITVLHIVFGELAPKTMALQRAEKIAILTIVPLTLFAKFFWPFTFVLNGAGNLVLKIFGFKPAKPEYLVHSEEEIKMILKQSAEGGVIQKEEVEMVSSVFKLGDITVKEIMVPRKQIVAFKIGITLMEMIDQIEKYPHSRFPIYKGAFDHIIGFIHIKDVYALLLRGGLDKKITESDIRKIFNVHETKKSMKSWKIYRTKKYTS